MAGSFRKLMHSAFAARRATWLVATPPVAATVPFGVQANCIDVDIAEEGRAP